MNTGTILILGAVTAMANSQAVKLPSGGYRADSPYSKMYNTGHAVSFKGTVVGIQKAPPIEGMAPSESLLVKSTSGGTISVELGPTWFVDNQEAKIHMKDHITVTGSKVMMNGHGVILAMRLVHGKQVLAMRTSAGRPYWSALILDQPTAGDATQYTGDIVRTTNFMVDGVQMVGYVIRTPNGLQNVAMAPAWYMEQQEVPYQIGSSITIYSRTPPLRIGNVVLADSVDYGGTLFQFRDNYGRPIWSGWGG